MIHQAFEAFVRHKSKKTQTNQIKDFHFNRQFPFKHLYFLQIISLFLYDYFEYFVFFSLYLRPTLLFDTISYFSVSSSKSHLTRFHTLPSYFKGARKYRENMHQHSKIYTVKQRICTMYIVQLLLYYIYSLVLLFIFTYTFKLATCGIAKTGLLVNIHWTHY